MSQWNKNPEWVELEDISPEKTTSKTGLTSDMLNKIVENTQYVKNTVESIEVPIEGVQRNGVDLPIVNKKVNIEVPIETITRNGELLPISSKNVDIVVPTDSSEIAFVDTNVEDAILDLQAKSVSGFDRIITTQAEFDAMLASPTWLDATNVLIKKTSENLGIYEYRRDSKGMLEIPETVVRIVSYDNARIHITGARDTVFKREPVSEPSLSLSGLIFQFNAEGWTGDLICFGNPDFDVKVFYIRDIDRCRFVVNHDYALETSETKLFQWVGTLRNSQVEVWSTGLIEVGSTNYAENSEIYTSAGGTGLWITKGGVNTTGNILGTSLDPYTTETAIPTVDITLAAASWVNNSQEKTITGLTSTHNPTLVWEDTADAELEAYGSARIRASHHSNNKITFKALGAVPTIDIALKVQLTR